MFCDSHFINVHISVRLLLFKPEVGTKLVGEVNYTNSSAVGLLVHGIFNASISDQYIPDEWEFYEDDDADASYWAMGDQRMEIGSLVAFDIVDFRNTDDILSIQGSILDEEKHGVVGKAEVALAERHRLDATVKSIAEEQGFGSKKRAMAESPAAEDDDTAKKGKKIKVTKVEPVDAEEGDGEDKSPKKKNKKKDKKEKK